ncbi:MAG TPA: hypothetical protein PKI80_10890, partial [Deltaproteobacteria bacterium]|nr:hypothetical protein [Deltaproteobacteria bacterium]
MAQKLELPFNLDRKVASDIVMAFGVMVVMVIVLVPLPTFLLDILLTFSIAIGVITLMVSMYTVNPL